MISFRCLTLPLAASVMLAACGPSPTSSSPPGPSATPAIDPCLVGTWTTTGVSGTQPNTGASVSGGAGQVLTITATGDVTIDPRGSQPIQLSLEGQAYTVTESGIGTGTLTTRAGQLVYTVRSGDSLSTTVSAQGGPPVGTPAADSGFSATYTCSTGQSLSIAENGVTYFFSAGGSSGNSASSSPSAS